MEKVNSDGISVPAKEDLPPVDWLTFSTRRKQLRRMKRFSIYAKSYMKNFIISANDLNNALR